MAPRLSGQTSIFGGKFAILTRKPRTCARILIYRTWPIASSRRWQNKKATCKQLTTVICSCVEPYYCVLQQIIFLLMHDDCSHALEWKMADSFSVNCSLPPIFPWNRRCRSLKLTGPHLGLLMRTNSGEYKMPVGRGGGGHGGRNLHSIRELKHRSSL